MAWFDNHFSEIISILFGAGGLGYGLVTRLLDKKKYEQEVKTYAAEADIRGDEFWKKRYDVLQAEVENKDNWWKERYDTLYKEYCNERTQSNELIKSVRTEFNEMRIEYERQREVEKEKYEKLLSEYQSFQDESNRRDEDYKRRINKLEELITKYEQRE